MTCKPKAFYRQPRTRKSRWALLSLSLLLSSLVGGMAPSWAQTENTQIENTQTEDSQTENSGIIVDPSLGDERSRITDSDRRNRINITGGALRGSNLFHSFERFNILESQGAVYFVPNEGIENVLARVVGGDPSNILGTLGVEGAANLWLLNPSGIVFGENARLDIAGSFYATTASAIPMGTGVFSAVPSPGEQLLSLRPEASFANYLTPEAGTIVSQGSLNNRRPNNRSLNNITTNADTAADPTTSNTTLTLAGSAITLEEALSLDANRSLSLLTHNNIETNTLRTQGTNITLESTHGTITVGQLNANANGADAGEVSITAAGNIETNGISAAASSAGGLTGQGGSIEIITTGGGNISNRGNLNTESRAINDSNETTNSEGTAFNADMPNADNGGTINLTTEAGGNITNAGDLSTRSRSLGGNTGNGGTITITAAGGMAGDITNQGILRSQSSSTTGNAGNGGAITITTDNGDILNQGTLQAQSITVEGNAQQGGDVTLSANNGNITNQRDITTQSRSIEGNTGPGGQIAITASEDIHNQDVLHSFSFARNGQASSGGDIIVLSTSGGSITNEDAFRSFSASDAGDTGRGGDITLTTVGSGSITNYGVFDAQALANGGGNAASGGNITMETASGNITNRPLSNTVSASNNRGSLNSRSVSRRGSTRNGGNISITSTDGDIVLNAYIDAKSYSIDDIAQNGGTVTITTETGSIRGESIRGGNTSIITSAVSGTSPDDDTRSGQGGPILLRAGETISGLNLFTLSNFRRSGDVLVAGTQHLNLENIQITTNEEIVGGSLNFSENRLFPSNLGRDPRNGTTADIPPFIINIPTIGQPGNVTITSEGNLHTLDVRVISNANSPVDAGNITLRSAGTVELLNTRLETNSAATGNGGNITLQGAEGVILDETAFITNTAGLAEAGDISITAADYLLMLEGSLLLADATGSEDGGRITIASPIVLADPNGNNDIIVNAAGGRGGTVFSPEATVYGFELQNNLTTQQIRNQRSNDISAQSESGQDGNITLNGITETPNQTESEDLDESFSTPDQLISNSCISPNSAVAGRFTIPGTGDLLPTPEDSTDSDYGLGDVQTLSSSSGLDAVSLRSENPLSAETDNTAVHGFKQDWQLGEPIIEPESIARLADGRIVFGQRCSAL